MNQSPAWTMTKTDFHKWLRNSVVYFIPVLTLFYIPFVIAGINLDGLQLTDFVPDNEALSAATLYLINVVYDFLLKFVPERKES